ncbi:hypothetical protein [Streptomyces sp. Amel2xE9]|uniref:hypothetical protein n=1 Tax=Streptomyces sp. Amel2xE9 TaxID=1157634 RepID=UPI003B63AAAD
MAVNKLGRTAEKHWQTYRPTAYAELGTAAEKEEFFAKLGMEASEEIRTLAEQILSRQTSEKFMDRVAARTQAMAQAREIVMHDRIFLPAEPGMENAELPDHGRL